MKHLVLAAVLICSSYETLAETPFKVQFDFSRTTGDRDHNFGERQPGNTFDVNTGTTNLIVSTLGYLPVSTKTNAWLLLNDTSPNTVVQVDFSGAAGDAASSFKLQSSGLLTGTYADDNAASITSLGGSAFRATTTTSGDVQFFRVRRQ